MFCLPLYLWPSTYPMRSNGPCLWNIPSSIPFLLSADPVLPFFPSALQRFPKISSSSNAHFLPLRYVAENADLVVAPPLLTGFWWVRGNRGRENSRLVEVAVRTWGKSNNGCDFCFQAEVCRYWTPFEESPPHGLYYCQGSKLPFRDVIHHH